jgi:hypothetical protein
MEESTKERSTVCVVSPNILSTTFVVDIIYKKLPF